MFANWFMYSLEEEYLQKKLRWIEFIDRCDKKQQKKEAIEREYCSACLKLGKTLIRAIIGKTRKRRN